MKGLQGLAFGLIGVLVGFALTTVRDWLTRRHRQRAHFEALLAEMQFCAEQAAMFLQHGITAPVYRLPTSSYQSAFPALLSDGAISGADITAVIRYFNEVETLNRGLDQTESHRSAGSDDENALKTEHQRNILKAQRLTVEANYYSAAHQALGRHTR